MFLTERLRTSAQPDTTAGVLVRLKFRRQCTRRGHLKGATPAQKVFYGSKAKMRELLGGKEENRVSPTGIHRFTFMANQYFPPMPPPWTHTRYNSCFRSSLACLHGMMILIYGFLQLSLYASHSRQPCRQSRKSIVQRSLL